MYTIVIRRTYNPWWGLGVIERDNLSAIEIPPYFEYASVARLANEFRRTHDESYNVSIIEGDAEHAIAQVQS